MKAKTRHRKAMLEYWGNPANPFCSRIDMHTKVLGITQTTYYRHFSPEEISEIENLASIERRKRCARERSEVLDAMYLEGKAGNVAAAREYLDRTEGKVTEKIEQSNTYPQGIKLIYKKAINTDD